MAASLGGSNSDPRNFVNMTVNANRSGMAVVENQARQLLAAGYGIEYAVFPEYLPTWQPPVAGLGTPADFVVTIGRTMAPVPPGVPFPVEVDAGGYSVGLLCLYTRVVITNTPVSVTTPLPPTVGPGAVPPGSQPLLCPP